MHDATGDTTMIEARYYQIEAEQALYSYFALKRGQQGNPIIAMPTATGKSVVIARFLSSALSMYPQCKFICATHVKELVEQNAKRLKAIWPAAPVGINSASLGQRDFHQPIIFGGIASMKSDAALFGFVDMLLIDECHLLSPKAESMYQRFIRDLKVINPNLRVVGFTATAFRMKQGSLTDEGLFTDIAYDLTSPEAFVRLIAEGFLAPIFPMKTETEIDTSDVSVVGGEFNLKELDAAVDKPSLLKSALAEIVKAGKNRRRWLIFCTSIENAEHCKDILTGWGIPTGAVHSKMEGKTRERVLRQYHDGELRALTNKDVLTTGYDEPGIDLIGMLRPTRSPGLWVQMAGRGMRPCIAEGKRNCILLDFAGNRIRLGPINDPVIPGRPKPKLSPGEAPYKICDQCGAYHHTSARICDNCGAEFPIKSKITATASVADIVRDGTPVQALFEVDGVNCYKHESKRTGSTTMKVTYHCGLRTFNEYVAIEHGSFRASQWWQQRSQDAMPSTVDEALRMQSYLRTPKQIRVWTNNPSGRGEVMAYEW